MGVSGKYRDVPALSLPTDGAHVFVHEFTPAGSGSVRARLALWLKALNRKFRLRPSPRLSS